MRLLKWCARHWRQFALFFLLIVAFVAAANLWMIHAARPYIYLDIATVPRNDVALVLGIFHRQREYKFTFRRPRERRREVDPIRQSETPAS